MIGTLIRIGWATLKRDRVALFLTFVLPIAFFSIFAMIFGNMGGSGSNELRKLEVLVVDLDGSDVSAGLARALSSQDALDVTQESLGRDETALRVRQGEADAAVIIGEGYADTFGSFVTVPSVELIYDASNPMAQHTIAGLLQASAFASAPSHLMRQGLRQLETFGGPLTDAQQTAVDQFEVATAAGAFGGSEDDGGGGLGAGLLEVQATAAHSETQEDGITRSSIIAYYAAGIGVMFLLFSLAGAASGLLEQEEAGTLERLLTSNVGMGTLLLSNWAFYTVSGFLQLIVMFVWGALVFDLELFTPNQLVGFVAVGLATAAAGAAFALVLATLCKTRAQLNGLSTIVILIMSAVGGSMIPRFVMPAIMEKAALFTFNGWALDGFLKVFWYDDPNATVSEMLTSVAPQLAVLTAVAALLLVVARVLGRRWETA